MAKVPPTMNRNAKAAIIGCHPETLQRWAETGGGPPFRQFGPRTVRYWEDDADAVGQAIDGGVLPKITSAA